MMTLQGVVLKTGKQLKPVGGVGLGQNNHSKNQNPIIIQALALYADATIVISTALAVMGIFTYIVKIAK
jgi:hypothetical protein